MVQVVAHRGAPDEALENSRAAFRAAVDAGARRIELDVQLSRDLVPVVLHDSLLGRTTSLRGELKKTLYQSLSRGRLKNGETIPSLAEIYQEFLGQIELNVELKSAEFQLVDQVLKITPPRSQRPQQIIFSSFHSEVLAYLKRRDSLETVALLVESFTDLADLTATMRQLDSKIIHPEYSLVTADLMSHAKEMAWQVVPYISIKKEIDCELIWTHLVEAGVDGFCTNYPRAFKTWLQSKGIAN